jgi:hypothetical protein
MKRFFIFFRNLLKDKCQKTNSPNREKEEFYV